MMRTRRSFLAVVLAATAVAIFLGAPPAHAQSLADAKRDGLVGERPNGYLGLVKADAPGSIQALVSRVNAERRQSYAQIAQRTGTSASQVGMLAGEKLIAAAAPGSFFMTTQGQWVRR